MDIWQTFQVVYRRTSSACPLRSAQTNNLVSALRFELNPGIGSLEVSTPKSEIWGVIPYVRNGLLDVGTNPSRVIFS